MFLQRSHVLKHLPLTRGLSASPLPPATRSFSIATADRLPSTKQQVKFSELQETSIEEATTGPRSVRLTWNDGHTSDFHFSWLLANCPCPKCNTSSGQRTLYGARQTGGTMVGHRPTSVTVSGNDLVLDWGHQNNAEHSATVCGDWLRKFSYDSSVLQRETETRSAIQNPMLTQVPFVSFKDVVTTEDGLYDWLHHINQHGLCIVSDAPKETGVVNQIASRVGPLSHTIYGDTFEVIATPKPINIAYTDLALPPHMDLAYFESPPGIQMLHCIRFDPAITGGESTFIDAHAVAEELKERDPKSFSTLSRVPATFQKDHVDRDYPVKMYYQRPHISVNQQQDVVSVYWSPPFEGPLRVQGDDVDAYYRAYHAYQTLLDSPEMWEKYGAKFRLREGEVVAFNNRRLLHGREAFTSENGTRRFEGCYVDIDMYLNRYHVASAHRGTFTTPHQVGGVFGLPGESRSGVGSHR